MDMLTTVHPAATEQLLPLEVPVSVVPEAAKHPGNVCRAIWLNVIWFTPSMMSISPLFGQSFPFVQMLGHT